MLYNAHEGWGGGEFWGQNVSDRRKSKKKGILKKYLGQHFSTQKIPSSQSSPIYLVTKRFDYNQVLNCMNKLESIHTWISSKLEFLKPTDFICWLTQGSLAAACSETSCSGRN